MAWISNVIIDDDKSDVGVVILTFTDTDATKFTFSTRAKLDISGRNAVGAAAIAARDVWQATKTQQASLESNMTSYINSIDV